MPTSWYADFGAYAHLQRNTPQTAAYGLNDSPAALAAWIVEKFRDWSDCDGDVERRFSKDELLNNVTLYWMTETIHSSCRLYYESKKAPLHFEPGRTGSRTVRYRTFPQGGIRSRRGLDRARIQPPALDGNAARSPFAAAEEPELLAQRHRQLPPAIAAIRLNWGSSASHHKWQQCRSRLVLICFRKCRELRRTSPVCLMKGNDKLMIEKNTTEEKLAGDGRRAAKKPYLKPEFRYERAFETMALACGKIRATQPTLPVQP